MKVKVISRNPDEYIRQTKRDIHRGKNNYNNKNRMLTKKAE